MLKELAFLFVFLLPAAIFYFARNESTPSAIVNDKPASKSKKKKKKPASKASDLKRDLPVPNPVPVDDNKDEVSKTDPQGSKHIEDSDAESPAEEPAPAPRPRGYVAASREADPESSRSVWTTATTTKRRTGGNKRGGDPAQALLNADFPPLTTPTTPTPQAASASVAAPLNVAAKAAAAVAERVRKVDPDADAPKVARVLRIKTDEPEESDEEEALDDGWGRIRKTATSRAPSASTSSAPLTKKQRQNQLRVQRKKEEKAAADAAQTLRLAQHRRELEAAKIKEFYSKGPGKAAVVPSQWTKGQGSSAKQPQSTAMIDENGALIWD